MERGIVWSFCVWDVLASLFLPNHVLKGLSEFMMVYVLETAG